MPGLAPPKLRRPPRLSLLPAAPPPAAQPVFVSPPVLTVPRRVQPESTRVEAQYCVVEAAFSVPIVSCLQFKERLQQQTAEASPLHRCGPSSGQTSYDRAKSAHATPSAAWERPTGVAAAAALGQAGKLLDGWHLHVYQQLQQVACYPASDLLQDCHLQYTGLLLVHLRVPLPVQHWGVLQLVLQAGKQPAGSSADAAHSTAQLEQAAPVLLLPSAPATAEMQLLFERMVEEWTSRYPSTEQDSSNQGSMSSSGSKGVYSGAKEGSSSSSSTVDLALQLLTPGVSPSAAGAGAYASDPLPHHASTEVAAGPWPLGRPAVGPQQPCGMWDGGPSLQQLASSTLAAAWRGSFAGLLLDLQLLLQPQPATATASPSSNLSTAAGTESADSNYSQQMRTALLQNLLRYFSAHQLWCCASVLVAAGVIHGCVGDVNDVSAVLMPHVQQELAAATALAPDQAAAGAAVAGSTAHLMAATGWLPHPAAHPEDYGYFGAAYQHATDLAFETRAARLSAVHASQPPQLVSSSASSSSCGSHSSSPVRPALLQRMGRVSTDAGSRPRGSISRPPNLRLQTSTSTSGHWNIGGSQLQASPAGVPGVICLGVKQAAKSGARNQCSQGLSEHVPAIDDDGISPPELRVESQLRALVALLSVVALLLLFSCM